MWTRTMNDQHVLKQNRANYTERLYVFTLSASRQYRMPDEGFQAHFLVGAVC